MPELLPLARIGREIGIVISGASAAFAPVMLRRDSEVEAREEEVVIIRDPRLEDYYMLGVLRWVTRYEPFLRRGVHNVYVEHPDALSNEVVMPFSNAVVEIYGAICDPNQCGQGFVANTYAPMPSSKVFRLIDASLLNKFLTVEHPISVGTHSRSGWRLPLDSIYAPYHIGVFGATGMGKSRLVVKLVSELARSGYSLVVFDHSGVDYVPYGEKARIKIVDASRIQIPPTVFASTITSLIDVSGGQRDAVEVAAICYTLKTYGVEDSLCSQLIATPITHKRGSRNPGEQEESEREKFLDILDKVARKLNLREHSLVKLKLLIRFNVPNEVFDRMPLRTISPKQVVEDATRNSIVVVDLSSEQDINVKRAVVAAIAEAAWEKVWETQQPVNIGLVVDEAQNYACEYCGVSARELETIAREGRKWGLFLVVASQRVARDIRTGIRSNLGTVFFSKLQSTGDLNELAGYLDLGRVTESSLAMLAKREFYVAGLLNPLRRPILLRVDDVEGFE